MALPHMVLDPLENLRENTVTLPDTRHQIHSGWTVRANIKGKTEKLIGDNIDSYFLDVGVGKDFLLKTKKNTNLKEIFITFDIIKLGI